MNQYILFILSPFLVLLFSFFIVKNKRIAWVFLIIAYLEPFLIEFISYGLSAMPEGYYTYIIINSSLYLIVAVFGFINFTNTEFRSVESKQNYKNIFTMLVGFIVVYVLMNLISVHYMLRSFENTFLLSGLFIVHDILFIYGLVLAVQKYKAAFIFLAMGQLLPVLIIIYLFFTSSGDLSYYSFQLISIIINISCVVIFLRGYFSNKLEFS